MSGLAQYAERLAALPRALAILELHPQGLPLAELAAELGQSPEALREVFLAYYLADLVELGDFGQPVVEFFGLDGEGLDDDVDPSTAGGVRVLARDPEQELGVDHLAAEDLGRLYAAGADLLALEPGNEVLRSALQSFGDALWPADGPDGAQWRASTAQQLHSAVQGRRRVRITYVRQWHPGATDRTIEPYRLVRTRRGWEVDAGPADDVADVRTFLVSGIADCEVLEETFDPPADLDDRLRSHRTPVEVELVVPQARRWVVDRYAESVTVVQDDEESVALRAAMLPPVEQRLGLLLLVAGPQSLVVRPEALQDAGDTVAKELRAHHASSGSPH